MHFTAVQCRCVAPPWYIVCPCIMQRMCRKPALKYPPPRWRRDAALPLPLDEARFLRFQTRRSSPPPPPPPPVWDRRVGDPSTLPADATRAPTICIGRDPAFSRPDALHSDARGRSVTYCLAGLFAVNYWFHVFLAVCYSFTTFSSFCLLRVRTLLHTTSLKSVTYCLTIFFAVN